MSPLVVVVWVEVVVLVGLVIGVVVLAWLLLHLHDLPLQLLHLQLVGVLLLQLLAQLLVLLVVILLVSIFIIVTSTRTSPSSSLLLLLSGHHCLHLLHLLLDQLLHVLGLRPLLVVAFSPGLLHGVHLLLQLVQLLYNFHQYFFSAATTCPRHLTNKRVGGRRTQ